MAKDSKDVKLSTVLPSRVQGPPSPSPSLVQFVEDWVKVRGKVPDVPVLAAPASSPESVLPGSKSDAKRDEQKIDLAKCAEFLPADEKVRSKILTGLVESYARIGRLDCFAGIGAGADKLLESWRNPVGSARNQYDQWFGCAGVNIDTRMTTTEWGDPLNSTNVTAGRCLRLTPIPATLASLEPWSRQTDQVKIKAIEMNIMITPTINLTGSTPPLMDAEQQIVEVLFLVDTWAYLSNKTNGLGTPFGLLDPIATQYTSSVSPNAVLTVNTNGGSSVPAQCFMYPTNVPNPMTHNQRFRILKHCKFPIRYYSNWIVSTTAAQTPGENQYHHIYLDLKDDPIHCPYAAAGNVEPYLNGVYMLLYGNCSTTQSNGYYSMCHYNVKVTFQDCGNQ